MARVPEARHEGGVWSGLVTEGSFPDTLRDPNVDEAVRLTYLTRKWISPFSWLLHKNFKTAQKIVGDRKYTTREIKEPPRWFTVTIPSSSTDGHRSFGVSNDDASRFLQPYHTCYIKGLYATPRTRPLVAGQVIPSVGSSLGANIGPDLGWSTGSDATSVGFSRSKGVSTSGEFYCDEEQLFITGIGAPDSGGLGHTMVTIDRCVMAPSAHDLGGRVIPSYIISNSISANIAGTNGDSQNAAQIVAGDIVFRGMPSYIEGGGYPEGSFQICTSDENYTQLFKYAVSETKESSIPKYLIKERPMDIHRWVTLNQMNLDKEYSYLLGKKGMRREPDGKEQYFTGGVREYIPKDSDHYLVFPNTSLTYSNLLWLSQPLLNLCNSGTMWAITGTETDIALRQTFANDSRLVLNKAESKNYSIEVNSLMIGDITLNLIRSQLMTEMGYGKELMCLDMAQGDSFEPVTNKGWDYVVEKNIQAPGINVVKEGIQGMFGLRRRRGEHHCIIDLSKAI